MLARGCVRILVRGPRLSSSVPPTAPLKVFDAQGAREFVKELPPDARRALISALASTSEQDAALAFRMADRNRDGRLSRAEFMRWYEKRHAVPALNGADAVGGPVPQPTLRQHLLQFLRSAVPFVGFGFLDNSIMLISGDFIEENIGTVLAISTMASAALGNAVSDVAGIGFSRFIEAFSDRLGLPNPGLTVQQLELRSIARTRALGNVIGVAVGCLLGMAPLLFMHKSKHSTDAVPDAA